MKCPIGAGFRISSFPLRSVVSSFGSLAANVPAA
jgi:hypothetical protein